LRPIDAAQPSFSGEGSVSDLVKLGLYELVWNHPPLPDGELLAKVASPHARRTYQQAIKRFYGCIERDPWLVTPPAIEDYKATLLYAYAPAVVAVHLQVIRALYDEAVQRGLLPSNPAAKTSLPALSPERGVRLPPRALAAERAAHLPRHTHAGRRERALSLIALHTALSDEEVNALRVGDFLAEEGQGVLYVRRAEGRPPVRVVLPDEAKAALDAYLQERAVTDESPLFSSSPWWSQTAPPAPATDGRA
jgi:integrase